MIEIPNNFKTFENQLQPNILKTVRDIENLLTTKIIEHKILNNLISK